MSRKVEALPGHNPLNESASSECVTDERVKPKRHAERHDPLLHWIFPEPRTTRIRSGASLLGRSVECDVVLGGRSASRRHATLVRQADRLKVLDEGSRNGVQVNGHRCTERNLASGDVLRLADHVAIVEWGPESTFENFGEVQPGVWGSAWLRRALEPAKRVAPSRLSVLIQGESGTGKEAFARAVHEWSGRCGDYVAVNCAAITETLVDAELFGHEKGAFTGADKPRVGHVERASEGTLFLDEVGELSFAAQAKLLRVIQEGEVLRVGGRTAKRVDVRWIAATHRDLIHEVEAGRFRLDLYHRLAGLTIRIPPLRQRRVDILPLFQHFVREGGALGVTFSVELVEALCCHPWRGNVRELASTAESMLRIVGDGVTWGREDLPSEHLNPPQGPMAVEPDTNVPPLDDRESLLQELRAARGNVTAVARKLRRSRQTIYTALKCHGLEAELERLRRRGRDVQD